MLAHQQRTGDDSLSQYYLQVHNSLGDMQMMPSILGAFLLATSVTLPSPQGD